MCKKKALGPGEYDCLFKDTKLEGMYMSNELFSSKLVVKQGPVLKNSNENHVDIQKGHLIVGINENYFDKMKKPNFIKYLRQISTFPLTIRFRDEKRASVERKLMQSVGVQWNGCSRYEICCILDRSQEYMWKFEFQHAQNQLNRLDIASDALISLNLAEIALLKVIVSGDLDYIKEAIAACELATTCSSALSELTSISIERRQLALVARAEALAMHAVVLFFADQRVKAAYILKKSYNEYLSLYRKSDTLKGIVFDRVSLGMGICNVFSAMIPPRLKWILTLLGVKCDPETGLKCLRHCYSNKGLRSRWAAMALINSRAAVRIGIGRRFDTAAFVDETEGIRAKCIELNPQSPLFLWSTSHSRFGAYNQSASSSTHILQAAVEQCSPLRAHLIHGDLAWHQFMNGHFDAACITLQSIVECDTAPVKKSIECAIYYAACLTRQSTINVETGRNLLARALEKAEAIKSSNPLIRRARVYTNRSQQSFVLLPFEAIYVHWKDAKLFSCRSSTSTSALYDQFALQEIDRIGCSLSLPSQLRDLIDAIVTDKPIGSCATITNNQMNLEHENLVLVAEWMTIRGLILRKTFALQSAAKMFAFVIGLDRFLPKRSYTVPICLFRLAIDTFERNIGYDARATSIHLLERALTYTQDDGFEYDRQYGSRIFSTLQAFKLSSPRETSPPPVKRAAEEMDVLTEKIASLSMGKRQKVSAEFC